MALLQDPKTSLVARLRTAPRPAPLRPLLSSQSMPFESAARGASEEPPEASRHASSMPSTPFVHAAAPLPLAAAPLARSEDRAPRRFSAATPPGRAAAAAPTSDSPAPRRGPSAARSSASPAAGDASRAWASTSGARTPLATTPDARAPGSSSAPTTPGVFSSAPSTPSTGWGTPTPRNDAPRRGSAGSGWRSVNSRSLENNAEAEVSPPPPPPSY